MPSFGLIIVGDEILSGKRQDKHLPKVIELLSVRGLALAWARYVGDDPPRLEAALRDAHASGDVVFCCGGIGATPDDHTRQCAARALGRELVLHEGAKALIMERMQDMARERGEVFDPERPDNVHRLNMGVFPAGAELIPNPYNKIPGFSVGTMHFLPGFPVMAWPMIEWVLDNRYAALQAPGTIAEQAILVHDCRESQITELMEQYVARYPALRMSCLPQSEGEGYRLELGLRGEPVLVAEAMRALQRDVSALGFRWQPVVLRRG